MTVAELIAKLQEFPPGSRVLMMRTLGDWGCYGVPAEVKLLFMEKVQEEEELKLELWEDTSVTKFEPGKFEQCVVFDW
jgi:hypothetical protein